MNSLQNLLSSWRSDPAVGGNIEAWKTIPLRPAQFEPLPADLHLILISALDAMGIQALYSHQSEAWEHIKKGAHVVIVTGTASGKTLSYNLPVLDHLLRDPEARALYVYPTKALAHDQLSTTRTLVEKGDRVLPPSAIQVYDGDTPSSARPSIRSKSRLVITNPDMLHAGILPHHTAWAQFFQHLKFIVIDEMHVYRGVFGSHVANVVRRLKRIARFYGSSPQFVLTSATIANPSGLATQLIENKVQTIEQDGSAHGPKSFLIYNPPIVDRDLGLRRSAMQESVRLAEDLLAYKVQTIIFGRSRRTVELILTYLRQRSTSPIPSSFDSQSQEAETLIRGYRSGYLPAQRRSIEQGLRQGSVRTVVATNALELGIDIGGLDAALLVGYPGTIAASWQQAGRAGRGAETSLAVLIATADPLDQFLASHPDYFFERSPEQALINPDNLLILLNHLRCAAFELPFRDGESFGKVDPNQVKELLEFLTNEGVLHLSGEKYFWMADSYPAQEVSLRSASTNNVILQVNDGELPVTIGQIDQASAYWMTHPEAIYLHEGRTYLVDDLDLDGNIAWLRRVESDYYTEPRRETTVQLLEKIDESATNRYVKTYGEISVTTQVIGYRKIRWYTHENLGIGDLDLPKTELQTTGYWLSLTEDTVEHLREEGLWSNDPNNYGPNWRKQRDLARERDEYRCQVCGTSEQGRSHAVHHKIPFRTFASYEQANRLENLVTLCPTCHRRVETAVRVRSGLAGLAYALGHLAPLFLMCDVGDLGIHSDPQSGLSEGMPTVVIYDLIPAGIGFSQRLFTLHAELIQQARELVASCECIDGCPSCVGPGGENGTGGKRETLAILKALE